MEEFKEKLEIYKSKLENEYLRANTISKKKKIAQDLVSFETMCKYRFDGIINSFIWENDSIIYEKIHDNKVEFLYHVLVNKKRYNQISESVIETYIDLNYPLYDEFYKNNTKATSYPRLLEKEVRDIVEAFINDYDSEWLKKIYKKMNESLVYYGNFYDCGGCIYPYSSLMKSFIFNTNGYGTSIFSASNRVHEYGHAYDMDLQYDSKMIDNVNSMMCSPFQEVASTFFEYAFLRYLKENRIYENTTDLCLKNFYEKMFLRIFDINILTKMEKIHINSGEVLLNEKKVMDEAELLKERLNYYSLSSYGDKISFNENFNYGLARLFAIYLYENYRQDKNNFKKEFKNSLLTCYQLKDLNAFNNVGINEEDIIKGDILRKVLKNNTG